MSNEPEQSSPNHDPGAALRERGFERVNEPRPRSMVHMWSAAQQRQQQIEALQAENKALREKLILLEDNMPPHLAEVAETDTHFVLLGTPGGHNCDQMGCGSVGHHVLFRVHKSEIGQYDDLLTWSRRAYMRLNGLMALRVSISPDVVTASIINEAPDSVKGGAA